MSLSIQFLGAAGTVTGSKYLLDNGQQRVLIDCGLFEGLKELRLKNWESFPVDPKTIDAVILTHAHLDHSGYLPLLVKNGFSKKIYCTPPTKDLCKILLLDSAKIQEEDAQNANQEGYSKHSPAKPLYTTDDAKNALQLFYPLKENQWTEIIPGWSLRFRASGHILGSAFIELKVDSKRIVFSGDLGRSDPLILRSPSIIEEGDYLVVESTYGNRTHDAISPLETLAKLTHDTVSQKGHLLIPSFAVGRAQDLLYLFSILKQNDKIPDIPIFLDSPLGINATEIFNDHPTWHSLNSSKVKSLNHVATMVKTQQQSLEILRRKTSTITIAGSGMVNGGRILHHLCSRLPESKNTVLLVGYQAAGTRGKLLEEGASEVKIYGQYIPVRCRVEKISSLSAHADQKEIIGWLKNFKSPPKRTFIVHGEPHASDVLRVKIRDCLGWDCQIPHYLDRVELS